MPAPIPLKTGDLLDAVRTLTWPARRRVAGTRAGAHASRLRGRAPELSEYRLYRQGDDPRDLDWKLLARSDRPFIRLADDRAIHETWFVVDASASMAFPESGWDKWRCACAITIGLASIAQRSGDPVALLVPGAHAAAQLAPTTRRDAVVAIERALAALTPSGNHDMAWALAHLPSGARLVVITDLLGDEAGLRTAASGHFARGGEVLVIHLLSRSELELDPRLALVHDPERPETLHPVDPGSVTGYAHALGAWLDACRDQWVGLGATYARATAEDDPARIIRAVIEAVRLARTG